MRGMRRRYSDIFTPVPCVSVIKALLQVMSNVSRKYNEATVKCEVHNIVGTSADSKTLEVACEYRISLTFANPSYSHCDALR